MELRYILLVWAISIIVNTLIVGLADIYLTRKGAPPKLRKLYWSLTAGIQIFGILAFLLILQLTK